jgi:23S rRNA (adenine2030-N6)-methyltransferase
MGHAMLSYRHAFHAGSPADVLKHAVLAYALAYATCKPRPLYVLDTHAGAGGYDLGSAMAAKTGEAATGILRLQQAAPEPSSWPPLVADLLGVVRDANPDEGPWLRYPGSPYVAQAMLRPDDRLELVELHPTDHADLADRFEGEPGVRVLRDDGLAYLQTALPPFERRGVVLIDPSYEVKTDYGDVVRALAAAHRRFGSGVYLLWYPVLERERADALLQSLAATGIKAQYRLELCTEPDDARRGLTGSGLVVVNPPYTLPDAAAEGLPWLAERLGATGPVTAGWLVAA